MLIGTLLLSSIAITLPAEATVSGAEISLGEIAVITGDNAADVARLERISLGYAPAPGYTRVFHQWKIESLVRQQVAGAEVSILGSETCRVAPLTSVVSSEDLAAAALGALEELLAGQDVEITATEDLEDEVVPKGNSSVRVQAKVGEAALSSSRSQGRWSVPVEIVIDGMPYRTVWVPYQVKLFRVVPVLVREIQRGDSIGPADIIEKRIAMSTDYQEEPLASIELAGATAKRLLAKDQPVLARDVARVVAVQKGETVHLTIRKGKILVKAQVMALQNGYLGDIVAIRVLRSEKDLTARVVGNGQVRIDFSQIQ